MSELFIWAHNTKAPKTAFLSLLRTANRRYKDRGAEFREFALLTSSPANLKRIYSKMGLVKVQETWVGVG